MKPTIGNWYRIQGSDSFEVVAYDEDDGTIELQYFDGTVEEFDLDSWEEQEFEDAQAPVDWTGSVDMDKADYGAGFDEEPHEQWANPLDFLDNSEE